MMNHPMICYELATAQQREVWQEAELARQARAATPDQPDLVERLIQHVWKQLGLPAREAVSQPTRAPSGRLPSLQA
jgi:hypothetical protein